MITVTGAIQTTSGAALHANLDFISKSTPLTGGGIIITNTDASTRSNPRDGTFSVPLAPGNYQVVIRAQGQSSSFNIAVPSGSGTATIDTLLSTPLQYTFNAPQLVFNGHAGNITFIFIPAPPAPTASLVNLAGGEINNIGGQDYTYWISWVAANGQTTLSPLLDVELGAPIPGQANRIALPTPPQGVASVNIWRSYNS
ncbi:MAG TPA: hypothetical protein VFB72_00160, partial [Verrucomicrobiae bacterium]|nr:hypothetical protein [Verrucomicrobiae bacterium]